MGSKVTTFLVGAIIGIVLGFAGSYMLGQRYAITKCYDDTSAIKTDRWTGKTWIMIPQKDENSKYISSFSWQEVSLKP